MQVIIRSANGTETIKTLTTHYTISGVVQGGAVTTSNIPATGETVVLRVTITNMDLMNDQSMSADTIEAI